MEEKNELNDIILNKNNSVNNNKKIILAVATLGVILIIVVMLMNSLSSNNTNNLPQPTSSKKSLLAEKENTLDEIEEPLFEDVEVIDENSESDDNLDQIAQRLKKESLDEDTVIPETKTVAPPKHKHTYVRKIEEVKVTPKMVIPKVVTPKYRPPVAVKVDKNPSYVDKRATLGKFYLQVGSFSTFEPNKKFLKSITDKGFTYKYHQVTINSKKINKVLIGPFDTRKEAKDALRTVRTSVEAGAFLTKI